MILEQIHHACQGEDREDPVAENRESGVEFDPDVEAQNGRTSRSVPMRHGKRQDAEKGSQSGGEKPEQAHAEDRSDSHVEENEGPNDELDDLEPVSERATFDDQAAQVESDGLGDESGQDDAEKRGARMFSGTRDIGEAEKEAAGIEKNADPHPGTRVQ